MAVRLLLKRRQVRSRLAALILILLPLRPTFLPPDSIPLMHWTDFSGDYDETNGLISSEVESKETPGAELGPNSTVVR